MAISFVGAAGDESESVVLPTHESGDLLLIFTLDIASPTPPTPPSGWATAGNIAFSGTVANLGCFYKIATTSSELSGTFTGASLLLAAVYRDVGKALFAPFRNANRSSSSATINYPQKASYLVASAVPGNDRMASEQSQVLGISATTSNSVTLNAPSGMTNRASVTGATEGTIALHDTNGDVASWSSTNATAATAIAYASMVIDLVTLQLPTSGGVRIPNIRGGADQ